MSIDRLGNELFLWTFTFSDVLELRVAKAVWKRARQELSRSIGFAGVRVFELHPGGHGLHIHVVASRFYPVQAVRKIWSECYGGRLHVCKLDYSRRHYVAKYLQKQGRCVALKGTRLWATFGGFKGVAVKMIQNMCGLSVWYRRLKASSFPSVVSDRNEVRVLLLAAWKADWHDIAYGRDVAYASAGLHGCMVAA
tara:strand:+ start:1827 stop:2411 length:585 start_codon:yes stop_codon:yes gene_type:complete